LAPLMASYLIMLGPLALVGGAAVLVIEMTTHLGVKAAEGTTMTFAGITFDATSLLAWTLALAALLAGAVLGRLAWRRVAAGRGGRARQGGGAMSAAASPMALETRGLRKSFGPAEIICGVDLAIAKGERHAVIGPNGAGKSTLFNLISGLLTPSAGEIWLNG